MSTIYLVIGIAFAAGVITGGVLAVALIGARLLHALESIFGD